MKVTWLHWRRVFVRLFDHATLSGLRGAVRLYLPGWATDYRVFEDVFGASQFCEWGPNGDSPLLIKKNTGQECASIDLYVKISDPADIDYLTEVIARSTASWHLVGLSLGGFMAHELAGGLPDKVKELTMIGIREQYPASVCRAMQRQLRQNKSTLLADFLGKAFGKPMGLMGEIPTDVLSRGLDYLGNYSWDNATVRCPVTCLHGEHDLIAPLSEGQSLADRKSWVLRVLVGKPHVFSPSDCGGSSPR